jgi:hypothetical protein
MNRSSILVSAKIMITAGCLRRLLLRDVMWPFPSPSRPFPSVPSLLLLRPFEDDLWRLLSKQPMIQPASHQLIVTQDCLWLQQRLPSEVWSL